MPEVTEDFQDFAAKRRKLIDEERDAGRPHWRGYKFQNNLLVEYIKERGRSPFEEDASCESAKDFLKKMGIADYDSYFYGYGL